MTQLSAHLNAVKHGAISGIPRFRDIVGYLLAISERGIGHDKSHTLPAANQWTTAVIMSVNNYEATAKFKKKKV
jgi:hypothetical protein